MARPVILRFIGDTSSLDRAMARVRAETATLAGPMAGLRSKLAAVGSTAMGVGSSLTKGVTLPIAALGFVAGKLAVDFESSMSKIVGLVGVSQKQVDAWGDDVLALARKLPASPKELADALFFVTSAGLRGKDALNALKASAEASAAGLGETKVVADAVTSAMNAYGIKNLSAAKAADILVATVREGKMPSEDLAGAIGKVISPAQALGISFDQVGASIASMTRVGLDANEAATAMRGIMKTLVNPTEKTRESFRKMGIDADGLRAVIREKGLYAGLMMLREGAKGNVEEFAKLFPNVRALNGFMTMTGENSAATAAIFEGTAKSAGSLDKGLKAASKTAKFKMEAALSSLQATGIQFGQIILPIIGSVVGAVGKAFDWLGRLSPVLQKVVVVAILAAAAIGPLVWIFGALATAIGAILSPIGLIVIGIGAVIAAAVLLWKNWNTVWNWIKDHPALAVVGALIAAIVAPILLVVFAAVALGKNWKKVWTFIQKTSEDVWKVIGPFLTKIAKNISEFLDDAWPKVKEALGHLKKVFEVTGRAIIAVVSWIVNGVRDLFLDDLVAFLRTAWSVIQQIIEAALQAIKAVISFFLAIINGEWGQAWQAIKDFVSAIWMNIKAIVEGAIAGVRLAIGMALSWIGAIWGAAWEGVKSVLSTVWEAISGTVSGGVSKVVGFVGSLPGKLLGLVGSVASGAASIGSAIVEAVVAPVRGLGSALVGVVKSAWNTFAKGVNSMIPNKINMPWPLPDIDLPDNPIPTFAEGGIVTKPTLAWIGEAGAEAIIPLTRPRRRDAVLEDAGLLGSVGGSSRTRQGVAGAPSSGGGLTIGSISVTANDPREAARALSGELAWLAKTSGF